VKLAHLSGRFVRALWPGAPGADDVAWVETVLTPDGFVQFRRQPNHDQRHAIGVARDVQARLADTPYADDPRWLSAALLHDVGKLDARFGPVRRAVATLLAGVLGPRRVERWVDRSGFPRRCALYVLHDQLGADRVTIAGGRHEAAVWAGAHHRPARWPETGIPTAVAVALAAADGERAR
jgi:hypothetical protein